MRFLLFFFFVSSFCLSAQTPTKTFKDSIFNSGDLIQVPHIIYASACFTCKDGISQQVKDSLAVLGVFLQNHPKLYVQLEVHSDARGDSLANLALTQTRANKLREYLITHFELEQNQIVAKGVGGTGLLYSSAQIQAASSREEKERLHALNNRTILRVLQRP